LKRRNLIIAACFLVYIAIIILPPIIHHYIYPNMGVDFPSNIGYFANANLWAITYYAYVYIGYPLRWVHYLTGFQYYQIYLWFSYAILVLVGYCWYFVLSKLVNYIAGLAALGLIFVCAMGLAWQFSFGGIFDMMNIGIILPFLLYFFIKWYQQRKKYQLVVSLILVFVFGNFHYNGIYLAPVVTGCLVLYYGYSLYKKYRIDQKLVYVLLSFITIGIVDQCALMNPARLAVGIYKSYHYIVAGRLETYIYYASVGLVLLAFLLLTIYRKKKRDFSFWSLIGFLLIVGINLALAYFIFKKESNDMVFTGAASIPSVNAAEKLPLIFVLTLLDPFVLVLLGFAIYTVWGKVKEQKPLLLILGVTIIAWLGIVLATVICSSDRTLYDVSTIVALFTAILVGVAWKSSFIKYALLIVIFVGMVNFLPQWFKDTSAVKQVDKEAFAYLNTLNDTTYTVSWQVYPSIYNLYIEEQYEQNSEQLLITRSVEMLPNLNSLPYGINGTDGFILLKTFTDEGITVSIYEGEK
jgi:hypothetical protein